MKQQGKHGKCLKWVLISCLALVLVVGAVAAVVLLGGDQTPGSQSENTGTTVPQQEDQDLIYWNVERERYAAQGLQGNTSRTLRSDGYYYFRLAVNGEQVDIPVADLALANYMDMWDFFGLVLDENGVAVEMRRVEEFTGGLAAYHWFVEKVEGTKVTANTSPSYKGVSVELEVPETAAVYSVGVDGPLVGLPTQVSPDDELIAIRDTQGNISTCFVYTYQEPGDVYWNIERMYDTTAGVSTRQRDELGFYIFRMAFGGQEVEIRTRDVEIANAMDKSPARCMGLVFDEEGLVIDVTNAAANAGGQVLASWFHVLENQDGAVHMKKVIASADQGDEADARLTKYSRIVNVSGQGPMGELLSIEDVRVGDQVHCLTDRRGNIGYMFIVGRLSDTAKLCWNIERQYDSVTKSTKRYPAADGYYYIQVASEGEQLTVRTKDKEMATSLDSYAARCFSLELNGDEIVSISGTATVTGGGVVASWFDVISINGNQITATKKAGAKDDADYGKTVTFTVNENTDIFDVSENAVNKGSRTTLRVGDRVHGLTDLNGETHTVYVVNRPVNVPVYWNITRMYDSTAKTTTRKPDENGYYWFDMAVNGKVVRLKTADKEVVNLIDATASRCRGLLVSGDTIVKAYTNENVYNANGTVTVSWDNVVAIKGNTVYTEKVTGGKVVAKHSFVLYDSCKVYNVNYSYTNNYGEKTTVKVGDQVHCLTNSNGVTTYAFIVSRPMEGKVGWNVDRKWDATEKVTTRQPDAEGWYTITLAIDGVQQTLKTQNIDHIMAIDGQAAMCRGLVLEGDVIKRVTDPSSIVGTNGGVGASWDYVRELTATSFSTNRNVGDELLVQAIAPDCKVYNVSNEFKSHKGEETELHLGDRVHVLFNAKKEASIIYVITKAAVVDGATKGHCNICGQDVTWASLNANIENGITNNVHYYLEDDAHLDTYMKVKSANAKLFLNGHTLSSDSRVFRLESGTALAVYDSKEDGSDIGGKMIGKGMNAEETAAEGNGGASEGGLVMLWNSSTTFELYSGTLELAAEHNPVKNGGIIAGSGKVNIHGGTIRGGDATNEGGNIRMYNKNALLTVTGGTVENGAATHGGNIALSGGSKALISGGTIQNGSAMKDASVGNGGNVQTNAGTTAIITGGTIVGGQARRGGNIGVFGTVEISGTSLGEGTASHSGASLFTYGDGTLTLKDVTLAAATGRDAAQHNGKAFMVSGKVAIPSLYLAAEKQITVAPEGLAEGAAIHVKLANTKDIFATVTKEAEAAYFTCAQGQVLCNSDLGLYLPHTHCLCATGDKRGCTDHKALTWTEWTDSKSLPTTAGNYYLATDVELETYAELSSQNINLCLNGHKITSQSRVLKLRGTTVLNLTDCEATGEMVGKGMTDEEIAAENNGGASEGGVIMMWSPTTRLNLYGGTLRFASEAEGGRNNVKKGGVIQTSGDIWMYGGTIQDGRVTANGGNIALFNQDSSLVMYGGTIQNGTAKYGGNILSDSPSNKNNAVICLYGGSVTGGTATELGGGLYVGGKSEVKLGNQIQVLENNGSNIYLAEGKTLSCDWAFKTGAQVGITMAKPGIFLTDKTDYSLYFRSDDETYGTAYSDGSLWLTVGGAQPPRIHKNHCLCATGDKRGCNDGNHNAITWTPWEKTDSLPTAAGNYYLTADVELATYVQLNSVSINLCLNGYTITSQSRVWKLRGADKNNIATLSLTDCETTGQVIGRGMTDAETTAEGNGGASEGGVLMLWNGHTRLNLYGGTLRLASKEDGGRDVKKGGVIQASGKVWMYGGVITDGRATHDGGNISLYGGDSRLFQYGGTIRNGRAARGGNVLANAGKNAYAQMFLYIGTITGGKATTAGGGVYVTANSKVTVGNKIVIRDNETSNLYLTSGCTVNVDWKLASGAYVGITMADKTGTAVTMMETTDAAYFHSDAAGYSFTASGKTLTLQEDSD